MPESKEQQSSRLAEVLGAKPTRVASALFGDGSRYQLGGGKVTVEVYPEIGVTRVATPRAGIELRDRTAARVEGDWVIFPCKPQAAEEPVEDVRVRQGSDGVVVRFVYPAPPVHQQRPDRPHQAAERAHPQDPPNKPQQASTEASGGAQRPAENEKPPRVTVSGLLGRTPRFHTSHNGSLIARFPVAVHPNPDDPTETVWHKVVAFGKQATKLQQLTEAGNLPAGSRIDLVGYHDVQQLPQPDGSIRRLAQIRAAVVTLPPGSATPKRNRQT